MQPAIQAKLSSRIVVLGGGSEDYYSLRFGLTNKGYRNFSIVYTADELSAQLGSIPPDAVLIASTVEDPRRRDAVARIEGRYPGFDAIDVIGLPRKMPSQPLLTAKEPSIDTLAGRFGVEDIPINIELELTSRCNARCIFCPIEKMERLNKTMDPELLEQILAKFKELNPSLVYLCGVGEPLLYRGIVDVVRRISEETGAPVGVNTNGQLLKPELFQELVDAGMSLVNISVNGVSQEVYGEHMVHCSYQKVHDHIEQALAIKPEAVSLQGVITKKNYHEIPELVRYWTGKGVKIFTFNQCSNKSDFLDHHDELWFDDMHLFYEMLTEHELDSFVSINSCNFAVKQTQSFVCRVPMNFISVDVEGNILHCMHDFASVTEYGKITDYAPSGLGEMLMKRVMTKVSICGECNAPKQVPNRLIWNGQVVMEKEIFPDTAPWEVALAARVAQPPSGDAVATG